MREPVPDDRGGAGPRTARARLERAFYATTSEVLARRLLGCVLVRRLESGVRLAGTIVETEAYLGVKDRASHAFGGRRGVKNEAMYARAGTAYVYFTYGMHFCMNVVGGEEEDPLAVLIRALRPIEGLEEMRRLRGAGAKAAKTVPDLDLCRGPGRLCQALAIDRRLNHEDLTTSGSLLIEAPEAGAKSPRVLRSARIGLNSAGPRWTGRLLRYFVKDCPYVSAHRRGRTARG